MAVSLDSSNELRDKVRLIRKVRKLPLPGEVLVAEGDRVNPDTPVARIPLRPGIPWVIPAARNLGVPEGEITRYVVKAVGDSVKTNEVLAVVDQGINGRRELLALTDGVIEDISELSGRIVIREEYGREDPPVTFDVAGEIKVKPEELPKHMLRHVGQEVKKGQIIAKRGEMQAFFTKTCATPISGVISAVDTKSGKVTVSRPFKQVVLNAYVSGTVAEVMPEMGCVVENTGIRLNGVFGLGKETHGPLRVLTDGPEQTLTADMISEDCKGCVIVGGSFAANEALSRALEVGAKGVVTATVNYFNLTQSLGVKLGVGITGQEDTDLTVILMEGFGHLAMRLEVWNTLRALEGRVASVNGATQIRAGAIRPEILVPFNDYSGPLGDDVPIDEDLSVGCGVRIVSEPCFGVLGRVLEIVREPVAIGTEAKVPVVKVGTADGRQVLVPRANVEVL